MRLSIVIVLLVPAVVSTALGRCLVWFAPGVASLAGRPVGVLVLLAIPKLVKTCS
jgi:hypothetical protein